MTTILDFPEGFRLLQTRFRLLRSVQATALRGGGGIAIEYAPARWETRFATPTDLSRRAVDPIRAFVDRMRGGLVRVRVGDWMRRRPHAYPRGFAGLARAGGGAFDGTATVVALAAGSVGLAGLPAGFVLGAGDMIGLVAGERRCLHRIVEAGVATSGGTLTVTVEPFVSTALTIAGTTATFDRPVATMQLTEDEEPSRSLARETVAFSLIEVVR